MLDFQPDPTFILTASPNAGWAQVYAPGQDFCCVEPSPTGEMEISAATPEP